MLICSLPSPRSRRYTQVLEARHLGMDEKSSVQGGQTGGHEDAPATANMKLRDGMLGDFQERTSHPKAKLGLGAPRRNAKSQLGKDIC